MDRYIGRKLDGRYEILELVGIGGMANVYLGKDVLEQKPVAVKILRSEFAENEEFLRRFKNESKAIAMLSHDNIVKVFDVSFTEKVHFIVMEYIDGITLKEYIEQQGVIRWKEAAHFCIQILKGLQHAHDKGIVHRDVKPQNVMLLSDGTIKITDFGIARFARSETRTITDRAIGSVHYISPEQASGAATDQRTDIYSVGVILFEMLTGKLPFEADTPISVALKQIQAVPAKPREINPDIPEPLEEIVTHAMQKNVSRRYQSAAEMLRDFEEFKKNPYVSFQYKYADGENPINPAVMKNAIKNKETVSETAKTYKPKTKGKKTNGKKAVGIGTGALTALGAFAAKGKKKKPAVENHNQQEADSGSPQPIKKAEKQESTIPVVPVMAGITTAFVLVSLIFIFVMFYLNNPFSSVEDIRVPELVGMKYDSLKNSKNVTENFEIEVEATDFHDTYGKGVIYEQKPQPGRTVKVGSKIKIRVSGGQKVVTVPNVVNADAATAYQVLSDSGLKYTTQDVFSENVPVGSVVSVTPGAGTQVPSGTVVDVQVSMGNESKIITVPDLVGMKITDAQTLLENFKLKIGGQSYIESDLPRGTIIAQDPSKAIQVEEGTFINVVLSAGDGKLTKLRLTIPMPNLNKNVRVQAMVNGVIEQEEIFNPSEVAEWKPVFEGEGVANIQIIVDNLLYQEITLNFDEKTYKIESDHSAEF